MTEFVSGRVRVVLDGTHVTAASIADADALAGDLEAVVEQVVAHVLTNEATIGRAELDELEDSLGQAHERSDAMLAKTQESIEALVATLRQMQPAQPQPPR